MARYTSETKQYLKEAPVSLLGAVVWNTVHSIGDNVPVSGIYRCETCGDEITSNKGTPFPPQNTHQHPGSAANIGWRLIVQTQTKG